MPKTSIYIIIAGLILVTVFLYVNGKSNNTLLASVIVVIVCVVLGVIGLIPLWISAIFVVIGLGMNWKELRS